MSSKKSKTTSKKDTTKKSSQTTTSQQSGMSEKESELLNDLQRIQAEFINYKNRIEQEKTALSQFSKAQTIKELLPVIDDLERALAHIPEELQDNKWAQGVQKVYDRLLQQLSKLQVEKVEALNKPFDPNIHEAVQAEGEGEVQIVSEVLQNGYTLGDQIIRHVVVKVKNT